MKFKNSNDDLTSFICFKLLGKQINKKEKTIINIIFKELHNFDADPLVPNSSMIAFLMSGCGLDYPQVLASSINSFGNAHLPSTKIAEFILNDFQTTEKYYPGFGHPIYKKNDPRVTRIVNTVRNLKYKTFYLDKAILFSQKNNICLNIGGLSIALLLDIGFDSSNVNYLPIISRMLGISNVYKTVKKNKLRFATSKDSIDKYEHIFENQT